MGNSSLAAARAAPDPGAAPDTLAETMLALLPIDGEVRLADLAERAGTEVERVRTVTRRMSDLVTLRLASRTPLAGLTARGRKIAEEQIDTRTERMPAWTPGTQDEEAAILEALETMAPLTSTEIASLTGVARKTISEWLREMLLLGRIVTGPDKRYSLAPDGGVAEAGKDSTLQRAVEAIAAFIADRKVVAGGTLAGELGLDNYNIQSSLRILARSGRIVRVALGIFAIAGHTPREDEIAAARAARTAYGGPEDLLARIAEPRSLQDLSRELGITTQAVYSRLKPLVADGRVVVSLSASITTKLYQRAPAAPVPPPEPTGDFMIRPMEPNGSGPRAQLVCDGCGKTTEIRCDYERKGRQRWKLNEGQARTRAAGLGWEEVRGKLHCPECREKRKVDNAPPSRPAEDARSAVPVMSAVLPFVAPASGKQNPAPTARPSAQPEEKPAAPRPAPVKETAMNATTPIRKSATPPVASRSPSAEPPREPTIKQNRAIRDLLDAVYDIEAGRYLGAESDVTVAETLKDEGILSGWVTRLREQQYGMGSGNEEEENLGSQIDELGKSLATRMAALEETVKGVVADMKAIEADRAKIKDLQLRFDKWKASLGPKGRNV
ncbi:hypothetical protein LAZ40_09870 [Cereibacter sphaeroides]|uniref:hypothetical protein n=1 Tax=Cereibacter sphaeroides TaxID=1063 RepID=UPI001F220E60|nr:hypothetical protein [Cereibacter sphaeroides]MCE6959358.1 hypothetical protein [Cereibacter sphaeroides]MCE6972950.1 hypothetical protein [Cereibacter sphaeroides]